MPEPKAQTKISLALRAWLTELRKAPRDLVLLGSLASLAGTAWCLPESWWDGFCHALARAQPWRWRIKKLEAYRYVEALRPGPTALTPVSCACLNQANVYHERMRLLACYRPSRPEPTVRLEGREHLEAAIRDGRGVILWVGPFVFSDLLTKVALHNAPFAVSHLSRFSHGFSGSRFGEHVLNPIRTVVERRYLAERLVIERGEAIPALRKLRQRLRANRIVSVSAIGMAHQLYRIPFLNGSISMAGGAPSLAIQSGAALLPVFTGRESKHEWLTVIEPSLVRHRDWPPEAAITNLLLQYAALLEYYVTRWPDQFRPNYLFFQRLETPLQNSGVDER
jgi:lauroyl/myristoyl acyltransferase